LLISALLLACEATSRTLDWLHPRVGTERGCIVLLIVIGAAVDRVFLGGGLERETVPGVAATVVGETVATARKLVRLLV
jgi:hypothetical protein